MSRKKWALLLIPVVVVWGAIFWAVWSIPILPLKIVSCLFVGMIAFLAIGVCLLAALGLIFSNEPEQKSGY